MQFAILLWFSSWFGFADGRGKANLSVALLEDRAVAEQNWHEGHGLLWFQHLRRTGGTSLCQILRGEGSVRAGKGDACQHSEFFMKDVGAAGGHNLSLVAAELRVMKINGFAQEYGPFPGPRLLSREGRRLRSWSFIVSIRDPWARLWSQLKYEMSTCLQDVESLTACINGDFDSLGYWWSPTQHRDNILGQPGQGFPSPALYVDNYFTRILLNRTYPEDELDEGDLEMAQTLLHRASAVIVLEDFQLSIVQLHCSLGFSLDHRLQVHVRPYEKHEYISVAEVEKKLPRKEVEKLKQLFIKRNHLDYALYAFARKLARQRLAACSARGPSWRKRLREVLKAPPPSVKNLDPPEEASLDDLFGCNGATLVPGEYGKLVLACPRVASDHTTSWWSSEEVDGVKIPKRKLGRELPGAECWRKGFSWSVCCAPRFGKTGNKKCWDQWYNHERCCKPFEDTSTWTS
eukprot:gnl/MRDRNA2_/MRDRNA2_31028_c0_seq1.p1 gnl/MRDRNA2_/MRDRNA2_31028_c0~~gnl/MRDRNA2_/MRDRNA2_31028_c0_seq1.p1  ORF type:complete len:461 (+),score=71.32 gnl/MRDRNA2_/MRDRNA2_31028_c0_seq1:87-1469(+)